MIFISTGDGALPEDTELLDLAALSNAK